MANSNQVATLATEDLIKILGKSLPVMKSARAARYPLYLRTPFGPWPWNTQTAQDFLLTNAVFQGAASNPPEDSPADDPDFTQERVPDPENPGNAGVSPEPAPEDDPPGESEESTGLGKKIEEFFSFD